MRINSVTISNGKKCVAMLILSGIALMASNALHAQNNDEVFNESVTVTGSYKPEINEFDKINVAPQISDTATSLKHDFSYTINSHRLTSLYSPTRIKAARIIGEPTSRLYNSYLRVAAGNYWSPMAEFYYNSTRNKKINYGAFITHHSSWGTIGKRPKNELFPATYYGKNHFSESGATLFGKFILGKNLQLATDLTFSNDYNLYYGFNDSTLHLNDSLLGFSHSDDINYRDSLSTKSYNVMYNRLAWNIGVKSLNTEALGYSVNFKIGNIWAQYKQNELSLDFDGDVHYAFSIGKKSQHKATAGLLFNWQGYADRNTAISVQQMPLGYIGVAPVPESCFRNLFNINPYIDFLIKDFKIHVGLLANVENFDNADSTRFHIFPDVELKKSFIKNALSFSLGATGGLDANTLDRISLVNSYIAPTPNMVATSHYDFYLRMRVNFSKKLALQLHGEYNMLHNDLTFLLDTNYVLKNVFQSEYVSYNRVKAGGDFLFVNDEMLDISVGGNYYYYTDSMLLYRPSFDAHLTAKVNYHDKWLFGLQAIVLGKVRGSQFNRMVDGSVVTSVENLPLRYGLNLEVEYRHNRALSFFVKFDNLLYQRYYVWPNYPSQRITFLAGLTYTILTKK